MCFIIYFWAIFDGDFTVARNFKNALLIAANNTKSMGLTMIWVGCSYGANKSPSGRVFVNLIVIFNYGWGFINIIDFDRELFFEFSIILIFCFYT